MDYNLIIASISALVIANSFYFAGYLLTLSKNKFSNRLLSFFLFALALRISKSVIIILWPNAPEVFPAIGLIGMGAIGPFLLLYTRSLFDFAYRFSKVDALHFIPSVAIFFSIPFADEDMVYRFYQIIAFQISVYIVVTILYINRHRKDAGVAPSVRKWGSSVVVGTSLIWGAFICQIVFDTFITYLLVTAIAALVLYLLSFQAMKYNAVFSGARKKRAPKEEFNQITESIRALMEQKKIYKEPNVTISRLASEIKVQPYLVSQAINETYELTLPELLNKYRVEEVERLLNAPEYQHYSIEAIANECGFNAMSAFYNSFKKLKGITPAEFRKKLAV